MKLPLNRARMRERNELDLRDEIAEIARMTAGERLRRGLELSQLALALHRAAHGETTSPSASLEEKSRLWTLRRLEITR